MIASNGRNDDGCNYTQMKQAHATSSKHDRWRAAADMRFVAIMNGEACVITHCRCKSTCC